MEEIYINWIIGNMKEKIEKFIFKLFSRLDSSL